MATAVEHYPFKKGEEVEISIEGEGFRGSWFLGTVIRPLSSRTTNNLVQVEYKDILTADKKRRLKEEVHVVQLRPPPPRESRRSFKLSEEVDALYEDGWWEGVITKVLDNDRFSVFFRGTRDQLEFRSSQLRLHREWVHGNWVPPLEQQDKAVVEEMKPEVEPPRDLKPSPMKTNIELLKDKFTPGMVVEVSSDEEGFQGAYFAATVLEQLGTDTFLIEYKSLKNDDETGFLREAVDIWHLRPYPPETTVVDSFNVKDEVDVFYNEGWWIGLVTKVMKKQRYKIYFRYTDEEMIFEHSDLRPHHEWIDGKWVLPSRVYDI